MIHLPSDAITCTYFSQVLKYTLTKNHPENPKIFTETLLVLPEMREHSAVIKQLYGTNISENNPEISPLMQEVL